MRHIRNVATVAASTLAMLALTAQAALADTRAAVHVAFNESRIIFAQWYPGKGLVDGLDVGSRRALSVVLVGIAIFGAVKGARGAIAKGILAFVAILLAGGMVAAEGDVFAGGARIWRAIFGG